MKYKIAPAILACGISLLSLGGCGDNEPAKAIQSPRAAVETGKEHSGPKENIPSLIDLGRTFCIPCKMMAPILKELKKEYAGRFYVEFIDIGDNPETARRYRIRMIPTQIFFDASGKELYRHEGFFSKKDILKKWKELGIDIATRQEK